MNLQEGKVALLKLSSIMVWKILSEVLYRVTLNRFTMKSKTLLRVGSYETHKQTLVSSLSRAQNLLWFVLRWSRLKPLKKSKDVSWLKTIAPYKL